MASRELDSAPFDAFPATGFDVRASTVAAGAARAKVDSPFDVCHVGVVLRALCFVHGAVGLALAFVATTWWAWLQDFALGTIVALPGVLLWLIAACLLSRPIARAGREVQWATALALGAAAGAAGWSQLWLSGLAPALDASVVGPHAWWAASLSGAALAGCIFLWLTMRTKAQAPADQAARLAELQSRIRPHFLFNTLNTAIALARTEPVRTEALLEDLAELFRVALGDSSAAVSLEQEIDLAQRYLAIEQVRFGDRLEVVWELDPDAGAARVPPLLLQPLVENAVRHGVEPSDRGGSIRVRTRARRGQAVISIANTVAMGRARPGHGMALDNVRERLRLMHDVASQFDARMDGDIHRVRIVVPL